MQSANAKLDKRPCKTQNIFMEENTSLEEKNENLKSTENENQIETLKQTENEDSQIEEPKLESDSQEQKNENPQNKKKISKKKNPFLRFLKVLLIIILILIAIIASWTAFSAFNRKKSISYVPRGYSLYVHMDSVWKALEPMIDLRAADLLLSSPDFAQLRPVFMNLRTSPLRDSKLFAFAASRALDAGLYTQNNTTDFAVVVDMGILSALTRLLPTILPKVPLPGLSYVQSGELSYFKYNAGSQTIYASPYKNLLIASSTLDLLEQSLKADNASYYTKEELSLLTERDGQPIRLIVNAKELSTFVAGSDEFVSSLFDLFSSDTLGAVSFGITDSDINVTARLSLKNPENDSLSELIKKDSSMPALLSKLSSQVQYYTIINAGNLNELKNALFPLLPKDLNAEDLYARGETLSRSIFNLTLDDLLYSWTGQEFSVFGVEGYENPVLAIKVSDEKQRQKIFDKVLSSIILTDDSSLIVDGMRIPRIMIPLFFQNILSVFKVSVPAPYYIVDDGFIYFSESAEVLSSIHSATQAGKRLSKNENWKEVSALQQQVFTTGLFYDLENSIPFFLRENNTITQILQLYSIGRLDVRLKKGELTMQLQASAHRNGDARSVPGFPIELTGKTSEALYASSDKKRLFWLEDSRFVCALNLDSMEKLRFELPSSGTIALSDSEGAKTGELWAVTNDGAIYLFNNNLELVSSQFPLLIGEKPTAQAAVCNGTLYIPVSSGLHLVSSNGDNSAINLSLSGSIKSSPSVFKDFVAIYDKSFAGKIFVLQNKNILNASTPYSVPGIAFGSPAFLEVGKKNYIAFITQAGNLFVWENGELVSGFPIKIDGIFYTNLVSAGTHLFALSEKAELFRISINGEVTKVAIPYASAREGYISVFSPDSNGVEQIFVCADGNILYGFNENLEILQGFPIAGWGIPAFADVNGDKAADCFALTIDQKLNAWNLR